MEKLMNKINQVKTESGRTVEESFDVAIDIVYGDIAKFINKEQLWEELEEKDFIQNMLRLQTKKNALAKAKSTMETIKRSINDSMFYDEYCIFVEELKSLLDISKTKF